MAYTNETLPKQEFDSNIPVPAMMKIGNKHFIVPLWVEVTADFDLDKAVKDGMIVNSGKLIAETKQTSWPVEGSTGTQYTVKLIGSDNYTCDCMGFRRAKDGKCKHVKQIILENC